MNYRVDPDVLARILPSPFRPQTVEGHGIAGICLIRLKGLRPRWLPQFLGIGSENAAHRIAVEWDEAGDVRQGVYIPRRDTSSVWNALVGGRLFPGVHHRSRFNVREAGDDYLVEVMSSDGTHVVAEGRLSECLPAGSVFESLDGASRFFARGSIGYSATNRAGVLDGLELRTARWEMTPLEVCRVESNWLSDARLFPSGSVQFDSALLMRGIAHEWWGRGLLNAASA